MNRYMYCPKCGCYPDSIRCTNASVDERRWNGTEYESENVEFGDDVFTCVKCGMVLEERDPGLEGLGESDET